MLRDATERSSRVRFSSWRWSLLGIFLLTRFVELSHIMPSWSVPNHRNATQLFFTLKTCLVSEQILS